MVKRLIRSFLPESIFTLYHRILAQLAKWYYRNPSKELIVIGVTGTNGKSSTVQFTAQLLEALGEKVGYTTTAGFSIAGQEIENKLKMTMPGRFLLQKMLRDMVKAGCKYAIIETSSEGLIQYRHKSINYDIAVFTNLTPEHIERHGSFEAYKKAKGMLFSHLTARPKKTIDGKVISKQIVANISDSHADYFTSFHCDECTLFSVSGEDADIQLEIGSANAAGQEMFINQQAVTVPIIGAFQLYNVAAAIAALSALKFSLSDLLKAAEGLRSIPGRLEIIHRNPMIIIDYAYEPYALRALFEAVAPMKTGRVIGIHGSAGGGRDIARRPKIGALAAEFEDITIVTNEDPYDEDPRVIIEAVATGARSAGSTEGDNLLLIDSRAEAICKAIEIADKQDMILITGKGSETVMAVANGKKIPWNDKKTAQDCLEKYDAA
jgi:UDP-N-acetylmuramoyl-L-alanyl-D-glutamate--2,6-diaminopimelate ligase